MLRILHYPFRLFLLSIFSLVTMLPAAAQEVAFSCYLKHSSGRVLGADAEKRAVILNATDTSLRPLDFIPAGGDYYNLSLTTSSGERMYLALSGDWNTFFIDDPTADRAKYRIAGDLQSVFTVQCKANGKCLGTDDTNHGAYVYSDKNGSSSLHSWYLASRPDAALPEIGVTYFVNPQMRRQINEGWGVSLCWWAGMCGKWSDEKIDRIIDWLVSPEGLNYNVFRYNIGGGDDPVNTHCDPHHMGATGGKGLRAEMEGFKDSSDGDYIWERDAGQRKIMLKIKEKRPDAIFEAFSNSPPYYMTYSGCVAGNTTAGKDNLRPEYYEEFAHYLVDVCKYYKEEYGIEFRTLEPFNESMTSYWGANGGQEGCHFDKSSQVAFLKVLSPILKASGLNTVIAASDETNVSMSVEAFNYYDEKDILGLVGQWNTHTYSANNKARSQIGSLARSNGKKLWMSETGSGGSGLSGNLQMAQRLIDDVRYIMPDAWVDWQYIEENNDQWCLVRGNFEAQTYWRVKNYYVRQQFSRFLKQGYTYITTLNEQTLAAVNASADTLVLVALNASSMTEHHTAHLLFAESSGTVECYRTSSLENMKAVDDFTMAEGTLQFTLPATSIATFVIPVTGVEVPQHAIEPGVPYMIVPQYNAALALTASETVTIQTVTPDAAADGPVSCIPSQQWYFTPIGDGAYRLTNGEGKIITSQLPTYALAVQESASDRQGFFVTQVEGIFSKITSADEPEKAFDLSNESYSEGTKVGLWNYGTSVAAGHRNWQLLRLPAADGTSIGHQWVEAGLSKLVTLDLEGHHLHVCLRPGVDAARFGLYTIDGRQVMQCHLNSHRVSVPLQGGLYIARIQSGTREESVKLLVR